MPTAKARPKTAQSPAPPPGDFPIAPPIEPMLAKLADELPAPGTFLFEPKWDGFRAIVFRSKDDVFIQSRDLRPLDRYFPELHDALLEKLPPGCVLDGEIVIVMPAGSTSMRCSLRLHPAASRVAKLAKETPSSFVAFDAAGGRWPQRDVGSRRASAASCSNSCSRESGRRASHTDVARPATRRGVVDALRRRRPRRRHREAGRLRPISRASAR